MKIVITGIAGLLGTELARVLSEKHEVIGLTRESSVPGFTVHSLDISDQAAVYNIISKINPDIVIHSAALSNVDECERNPDEAYGINTLGARNIAIACQRFDTALLYISTDYVFSGRNHPSDGYTEFNPVDPISVYAKSKTEGEWFVQQLLNKFYIVRVSWLFGASRPNFISQMASSLRAGKTIKTVTDMISAPTYVNDLAEAIGQLIEKPLYGVFHLTNKGFASRYEIAVTIADMLGAPKNLIMKVTQDELRLPAKRPAFSGLRNYIWELEKLKPLRPWQEAVAEFLSEQNYL